MPNPNLFATILTMILPIMVWIIPASVCLWLINRDTTLSSSLKTGWSIVVVFIPLTGAFAFLVWRIIDKIVLLKSAS